MICVLALCHEWWSSIWRFTQVVRTERSVMIEATTISAQIAMRRRSERCFGGGSETDGCSTVITTAGSISAFRVRLGRFFIDNAPLEPANDEEPRRGDHDDAARPEETVLPERGGGGVPEVVGDERDTRRPDDAAGGIPAEEAPPVHVRDACDPRGGDPEHGDEPSDEDRLAAVLREEPLAFRQVLLGI